MSVFGEGFLSGIGNDVLAEWRVKSKNALYRRDPEAWINDVLGARWHNAQREFVYNGFLTHQRTLVKSGNGSGKSLAVGQLISWGIAVHEIGELLCMVSAPTLRQVEEVTFGFLKTNMSTARARQYTIPGTIIGGPKLTYRGSSQEDSQTLVLGLKPAERDVVGTFQGIRAQGVPELELPGKTWVLLDEAGAVPADLFTAAESVTTGGGDGVDGNKILGIGNPDRIGTEFHRIFTNKTVAQDWSLHTISVLDLPTITGEVVYPDEPDKEAAMRSSGMNDQKWVDKAARAWGETSARYMSKVLGEFPDSDDRSFFSQEAMNKADDTEIKEDYENIMRLGVDVARFGEDDSMAYTNLGGRIRKQDAWSKATTNESATRIHMIAQNVGAHEVVIDAAGLGAGIADQVAARAVDYTVIKTLGAYASPDPTIWLNARAFWYDKFREAMMAGQIDLDLITDTQLREELLVIQYDLTPKGQLKIESKKDMAARGVKSPDALDAVIYSYINSALNTPTDRRAGDTVIIDPWEVLMLEDRAGLPI